MNYELWRKIMEFYLMALGYEVWESIFNEDTNNKKLEVGFLNPFGMFLKM